MPFKTLSHLGRNRAAVLQNPVTSGPVELRTPSKPCHIWDRGRVTAFKTLSHLGDYHKSFVVQRKFGVESM